MAPGGTANFSGVTDFKFSFVAPGTNTPVVVTEIHMSVLDLDRDGPTGATEVTSSKGYRGYVTDISPNIVASRFEDGRTKFSAVTANLANPTRPTSLTPRQRATS